MKILLIGPFPNPIHGMSLANDYFYHYLKKDHIDVDKFDTIFDRKIKDKKKQGSFSFKFLIKSVYINLILIKKIVFGRYTIVYITPGQSVLGFIRFLPIIIISKLCSCKTIQHIHGSNLNVNIKKANFILKYMAKIDIFLTDKFIFLSKSIMENARLLICDKKLEYCLNGVPIPSITSNENTRKVNVLFLSNLMKDKGIIDIISAIKMKKYECEYEFHFAGEIESEIKEVCLDFINTQDNCIYHGVVSGKEKEKLLYDADIFILPSYDEGVPLSILEAYANSCAVITTSVGGIPDIFENNKNGVFVKLGSAESISSTLDEVVKNMKMYKNNNREIAINKFSIETFYSNLKNILN